MGKQIKKKEDQPSDDKQKNKTDVLKEAYDSAEEDIEKDPDLNDSEEEDLDEGELARLDNSND